MVEERKEEGRGEAGERKNANNDKISIFQSLLFLRRSEERKFLAQAKKFNIHKRVRRISMTYTIGGQRKG